MPTFKDKKQQIRHDLKQTILQHASTIIQKHGIRQFSMRKLALELECSPATIYLYFNNKEEILNQLVESAFEELSHRLKTIDFQEDQPLAYLKHILRAYIDFGLEQHDHYQFAFMTSRTKPNQPLQPHEAFHILVNAVKTCVEAGIFISTDIKMVSQSIWACIHGITSLFIVLPNFPWSEKEKLIQHHIDILVDGNLKSLKRK
ncbi:MAG: TetR/AcrR family transcriptional regulator [Candidatus Neomarinimicrobiota bacterium]